MVAPCLIITTLCASSVSIFFLKRKYSNFSSLISILALSVTSFLSIHSYFCSFSRIGVFYLNDLNIHFVILTNLVGALVMILSTCAVLTSHRLFYTLLNLIFLFLNCFFMSDNLILLYTFFEASAVPMFILIGLFGSGSTRHKAAYKFVIYSLMGSVFLLPALIFVFNSYGTLSIYELIHYINIPKKEQVFLAIAFFVPFAIKMPIMPFHLWLPEAHVEAPTSISVLLAGLLLKTGSFGFYLIVIYAFPYGSNHISALVIVLSVTSLMASSLYALVQTDIKKLIAYSSIAHMSLVLIGLFTFTEVGMKGAYLFMLSHGINSAALFSLVGVLYDRGHVRLIRAYTGLVLTMPLFTTFFFIMSLGNSGFPFTPGFFAEFFTFVGFTKVSPLLAIFSGFSIILSLFYSIWCFSRLSFGNIRMFRNTQDLEKVEFIVLLLYLYSFTLFGFNTDLVLSTLVQPQLGLKNSAIFQY